MQSSSSYLHTESQQKEGPCSARSNNPKPSLLQHPKLTCEMCRLLKPSALKLKLYTHQALGPNRPYAQNPMGCFFWVPAVFFGYCRKGFTLSCRPGAHKLLEHAWTESEASPPPCPGSYLYLHPPMWTRSRKAFSPVHGFFFYLATYL